MRPPGLGIVALVLCIGSAVGLDAVRAHTTAAYLVGRRSVGLSPAALDLEAVGACDLDHSRVLHRRVLVAPVDQLDVARLTGMLHSSALGGLVAVIPRDSTDTQGLEAAERLAKALVRAKIQAPAYFVQRGQAIDQLVDTLCGADAWQATSTAIIAKQLPRAMAAARAPQLHSLFALPAGVAPGAAGPPLVLLHALSDTWCSLPSLCPLANAVGSGLVAARALFAALGSASASADAAAALFLSDGAAPGTGAALPWLEEDSEAVRDRVITVVHLHSLGRGRGLRVEAHLPPSPSAATTRLADAVSAAADTTSADSGDSAGAASVAGRRARRAVQPFVDHGLPVLVVSGGAGSPDGGSQLGDTRSQVQDAGLRASLETLLGALLDGMGTTAGARQSARLPPLASLARWMDRVGDNPRPLSQWPDGGNASASADLLREWEDAVGAGGGHAAVSAHGGARSGVELYPTPAALSLTLLPVSTPALDVALAAAVVAYLFCVHVAARVVAYGRAATL